MAVRLTVSEMRSSDRKEGEEFEALLLLRRCSAKTARTGNTFHAVEFGDRSGTFFANIFADSPAREAVTESPEGSVILIAAKVEHYQGRFSPRVMNARLVPKSELAGLGGLEALVEAAPEDASELRTELDELTRRISDPALRKTVELSIESIGDVFYTAPAAVAMHHAYRSGLLEHTTHMARACVALLPLYPEVNADLALAGTIIHDIGKAVEYSDSLAPQKTRAGILQGHVVLGYRIVRKAGMVAKLAPDILERLEHIVLSHQGELEWGAATMAATPEAVFVSMVDNLDAKMGMVQRALRIGDEAEYSDYLPGLKSNLLRMPPEFENIQSPDQLELLTGEDE